MLIFYLIRHHFNKHYLLLSPYNSMKTSTQNIHTFVYTNHVCILQFIHNWHSFVGKIICKLLFSSLEDMYIKICYNFAWHLLPYIIIMLAIFRSQYIIRCIYIVYVYSHLFLPEMNSESGTQWRWCVFLRELGWSPLRGECPPAKDSLIL